jgi:hypothetical protein
MDFDGGAPSETCVAMTLHRIKGSVVFIYLWQSLLRDGLRRDTKPSIISHPDAFVIFGKNLMTLVPVPVVHK